MSFTKKKICWITPDYYLCVDPFIVPYLKDEFEIEWILINSRNTGRKTEGLVPESFKPKEFNLKYRQKDPRIILQYAEIINYIKKLKFDLIYISFHGFPYFFPLFLSSFNQKKIIWGVHNVITPKGGSNGRLMDIYQKYGYKKIKYFHVFSEYQLRIIQDILPAKTHYYAPLTLDDYGVANLKAPQDVIRFLFFGYIKEYKRLDLLIKSFLELRSSGYQNIELIIAGNCENWSLYSSLIGNDKNIRSRIEVIPNKDIPDIVASCHYMVLPYQDSAQSAVLTLAYQYKKPVIVSNIEAFKQFVIENETGFYFENGEQGSLTKVLRNVIKNHENDYCKFENKIDLFVQKEFALDNILKKYRFFLNDSIQREKVSLNQTTLKIG